MGCRGEEDGERRDEGWGRSDKGAGKGGKGVETHLMFGVTELVF